MGMQEGSLFTLPQGPFSPCHFHPVAIPATGATRGRVRGC